MKIYIVNDGSREHIELMKRNNWGRMHVANDWKYPETNLDWALDNGAYSCWKNNLPFNDIEFEDVLQKIEQSISNPDFIVVPDIVAGGYQSFDFSMKWLNKIPAGYNCYLAVQDGMKLDYIADYVDLFEGLFVGGTIKWKLKTAHEWVQLAHDYNRKCHIGRAGTLKKLIWARYINADSIDSSNFARMSTNKMVNLINTSFRQSYL